MTKNDRCSRSCRRRCRRAASYSAGECHAQSTVTWRSQARTGDMSQRPSDCTARPGAASRPRRRRGPAGSAQSRSGNGWAKSRAGAATATSRPCWIIWAVNSTCPSEWSGDSTAPASTATATSAVTSRQGRATAGARSPRRHQPTTSMVASKNSGPRTSGRTSQGGPQPGDPGRSPVTRAYRRNASRATQTKNRTVPTRKSAKASVSRRLTPILKRASGARRAR